MFQWVKVHVVHWQRSLDQQGRDGDNTAHGLQTLLLTKCCIILGTNVENGLDDDLFGKEISIVIKQLSIPQWLAEETDDDAGSDNKYTERWVPCKSQLSSHFLFGDSPRSLFLSVLALWTITLWFKIVPNNLWLTKGWHGMDLTEAEEIKKRWQEYTEEIYNKVSLLFRHSVVSDYLRSHGLQRARLPCHSPSLGACSNSCPLSRWCSPTISSSVAPLLLLPAIFPSIRVFSRRSVLPSGGQSIGTLASASVLPMYIQGWFSLGLTGLISL